MIASISYSFNPLCTPPTLAVPISAVPTNSVSNAGPISAEPSHTAPTNAAPLDVDAAIIAAGRPESGDDVPLPPAPSPSLANQPFFLAPFPLASPSPLAYPPGMTPLLAPPIFLSPAPTPPLTTTTMNYPPGFPEWQRVAASPMGDMPPPPPPLSSSASSSTVAPQAMAPHPPGIPPLPPAHLIPLAFGEMVPFYPSPAPSPAHLPTHPLGY